MSSPTGSSQTGRSQPGPSLNGLIQTPIDAQVQTEALRRALRAVRDEKSAADLMFLENWELSATPGVAAALRASQLRRANPALVAAIRAELTANKRKPA